MSLPAAVALPAAPARLARRLHGWPALLDGELSERLHTRLTAGVHGRRRLADAVAARFETAGAALVSGSALPLAPVVVTGRRQSELAATVSPSPAAPVRARRGVAPAGVRGAPLANGAAHRDERRVEARATGLPQVVARAARRADAGPPLVAPAASPPGGAAAVTNSLARAARRAGEGSGASRVERASGAGGGRPAGEPAMALGSEGSGGGPAKAIGRGRPILESAEPDEAVEHVAAVAPQAPVASAAVLTPLPVVAPGGDQRPSAAGRQTAVPSSIPSLARTVVQRAPARGAAPTVRSHTPGALGRPLHADERGRTRAGAGGHPSLHQRTAQAATPSRHVVRPALRDGASGLLLAGASASEWPSAAGGPSGLGASAGERALASGAGALVLAGASAREMALTAGATGALVLADRPASTASDSPPAAHATWPPPPPPPQPLAAPARGPSTKLLAEHVYGLIVQRLGRERARRGR